VELAAVVAVPVEKDLTAIDAPQSHAYAHNENSRPLYSYSSRMPILGNDLLHAWTKRVRQLGMKRMWLTSTLRDGNLPLSALAGFAQQGFERLLMITLKSYAEMDLADLIRFHNESRNSISEAHDDRGQLGVCLVDRVVLSAPKDDEDEYKSSVMRIANREQIPYSFRGYAKRILSTKERQELVGDGLTGACAMRPLGNEIRSQVWIGEDVYLADSVRVIGPAYIGAGTVVRAGATIGPFASVERDCVVDCGTTVERSTVLPHTYLAPGLLIRDALVDGGYMEHLVWGAVADLQQAGLGSRIERRESAFTSETTRDAFSREGAAQAWGCDSSSADSLALCKFHWHEVQL
jgi:carbonic anhydrase/acetyltransferase-like protein (isoleucine patch superfamily)